MKPEKIGKDVEPVDLKSDLKYIAAAFVMTVLMIFFMVLFLPDTPFEFW
jgi:hypothetical protein